ncbi:multiple epidermal growth factor-like domains protein 11 isoform X2 [Saccostrea cucullata]|uniref:multiple epidermal growth factor-like domains protein 11 isoform X2 n=1 Tax=Saccostrea cuccullata TaxID=36930 RepID=UPI002ED365E5
MAFVYVAVVFLVFITGYTSGYENIALNKPTWQSKQFNPPNTFFNASNAVDGLKSDLSAWGGQCVISDSGQSNATWWVNLMSVKSIHDIRIYYRTDNVVWDDSNGYTMRFLGFYVYISNTTNRLDGYLCFHDTNYTRSTIPAVVNITCPVHGQYVIYYNVRPQDAERAAQFSQYAYNELCEVEVYGCIETGVYGPDCSIPCPDRNCRYCHIETGVCQGCKPGYQGHQCELPCSPMVYGEICSMTCGNCSGENTCHNVNGSCTNGCDVGVYGDKCKTPCPIGWHGQNCSDMCSNCNECDRFSGQCESPCYSGWKGLFCNNECSGGGYGQACEQKCGACLGYKQCHHINGSCLEGCDPGFKGDLCKTGCSSGKFGINCKQTCNKNCGVPYQCNRATGKCEGGCQPGWEGPRCYQVCKQNKYGENCSHSCGFCQDSNCHHVNGSCSGKCSDGYQGTLCNEQCKTGFYGENCKRECSIFCKTSRDCNHVTGNCNEGCIGGWQGAMCLQVAEKKDDADFQSRFYGVLAVLCVCLIIIAILIAYICFYRASCLTECLADTCRTSWIHTLTLLAVIVAGLS